MYLPKYKHYLRLFLPILIVSIVFVSVLLLFTGHGNAAFLGTESIQIGESSHPEIEPGLSLTGTTTVTVNLPVVMRNYPWISPFGIETNRSLSEGSQLFKQADVLGTKWVRMNGRISWRVLQPNEGDLIDWTLLENFENELRALKAGGMTPIVTVDDNPAWAVKPYYVNGEAIYKPCAAIKTEKFGAYADFVRQIVERYKNPQYDVRHWELGNEPDVDPKYPDEKDVFGCWGDINDPFYGGEHYGEMLKVVYPVIKTADPRAKVWMGGLLLSSPNTTKPENGKPEKFLAGILESGAGPYFDILPYHAYFGYNGQFVDQDNGVPATSWYPYGGIVSGKAAFLRTTLEQYGVKKPIFLNEFALNCPEYWGDICDPPSNEFLTIQADQLVRSITRGLSNQIMGFAWYTLEGPGWRNGSLLDENQRPRPSYDAYQTMINMLDNAEYLVVKDYGSGVEAYRFDRGTAKIDVLWAIDNKTIMVTFSKTSFIEARNGGGEVLKPTEVGESYQIPVGFSPIYLVFER